eukprot:TRINITY_DN2215_c0_g1_i1.p1 TRINITY_DN2215_c0_g1~~TRINITY_DN2215_c0_g1_i1.p1  ORF type:complete len:121 (+),score=0.33 TRINITY_DN2215_c0_g1_i1:721-1083(+)
MATTLDRRPPLSFPSRTEGSPFKDPALSSALSPSPSPLRDTLLTFSLGRFRGACVLVPTCVGSLPWAATRLRFFSTCTCVRVLRRRSQLDSPVTVLVSTSTVISCVYTVNGKDMYHWINS